MASAIDMEVQRYLSQALERARAILMERRATLDALAQALAEKEELSGDEVKQIAQKQGGPAQG
jgi:cell division protease FtsH